MCAVEWKKLGDVVNLSRGVVISKDYLRDNEGIYPVYSSQTANDGVLGRISTYNYDGEFLTWTTDGANAGTVFHRFGKFSITNVCGLIKIKDEAIITYRYLYYWLNLVAKNYVSEGMGNPKLMSNAMGNIVIPLIPVAKQQEIVSHLDIFTTLISNLESELDMRRKQYEHYRNQLLNFEGVEKLPLSEIFEMRGGYTPSTKNDEFWEDGTLPWFRMEDIRENGNILSDSTLHITPIAVKKNGLFPMNSIILATSATIGVHALLTVPALSNQRFTAFYPKEKFEDKVNYKYTYYVFYIIDEWCKNNTVQGGFASVDMAGLRKYLFPLPSLAKQQQIVEKLDAFEQLIQSLETEIKLRKQQYEYYREKLLTFD